MSYKYCCYHTHRFGEEKDVLYLYVDYAIAHIRYKGVGIRRIIGGFLVA